MTKKAKSAIALSALVAVGAVGGSFAYWNQTATIDNPFDTGTYGTSLVENFTPEDGEDWEPGATIDKEVYVTNDGDYDLIVRVKLDETWTYTGEDEAYKTVTSTTDTNYDDDTDYDIYEDSFQVYDNDGLTARDGSVVEKTFSSSDNWVAGGDGWYYYTENVEPGEQTDNWLTDVTLDEDVDMGSYEQTYYLSTDDGYTWVEYTYEDEVPTYVVTSKNGVISLYYNEEDLPEIDPTNGNYVSCEFVTNNKVVTTVDEDAKGYSDSDYVLTITVETVQATKDAVNSMFGDDTTEESYASAWTYAEID